MSVSKLVHNQKTDKIPALVLTWGKSSQLILNLQNLALCICDQIALRRGLLSFKAGPITVN